MLAALSTGHEVGLGLSGLAFVAFALISSMVIPRVRLDFPGRNLGVYLAIVVAFFVGMIAAVSIFGKESKPPEKHQNAATPAL